MQEREKIRQLFERYREGCCNPEEEARLHAWLNQYARNEADGLDELHEQYAAERAGSRKRWLRWFPYAAAVATLVFATVWYFNDDSTVNHPSEFVNITSDDVAPGGNRAILTLADGRAIPLSEARSGIVVGNSRILYEGGAEELTNLDDMEVVPLMLSTPRGGTYQVTLSDGTRVWLNAASTLEYPSRFAGDERVVEVHGEAYFSVTEDSKRPFRVISRGQEIEVLGTEFNISAYDDEVETKTTLVEGSVQIANRQSNTVNKLLPGEQSVVYRETTETKQVDVQQYIAWKDGNFNFDNTPLSDMMKQMARWYDVDVVYENDVPNELFNGTLSRNVTLQTVLELLRISEIKYRIQEDKLIIE